MHKLLGCLLLAAASTATVAAQPGFQFLEKQGPHAVGLRVVEQYDEARSFRDGAWPLQTLVWYPAQRGTGRAVVYRDYTALSATTLSFGKPRQAVGFRAWFVKGMDDALAQPTWARRDAAPELGQHPLVIYAASYDAPSWENVDLCEYLASHGYVVISGPGMGPAREPDRLKGAEAQARDIEFFIAYAHTLPNVDTSRIAVVGFSWGGLANVFAAARDPRIDALVSLDGSARYWPGLVAAAGIQTDQITVPLLFFKGQGTVEAQEQLERYNPQAKGPSVLNAWIHGDLVTVEVLGLSHAQFNSATQRNDRFFDYEFATQQQADYDRHDGVVAYAWVARYTREFLDARLKADAAAQTFMAATPAANGVPPHTLAVRSRPAQPMPASFATFQRDVQRRGFADAATVHDELVQANPRLFLDPGAITAWAYELLADGRTRDALPLMQLAVRLAPSSNTYLALGETWERAGDTAQAVAAYREAMTLDARNIIAKQRLGELAPDRARP